MKTCPKCSHLLYPINSVSDKHECLQKDCRYSEAIKTPLLDEFECGPWPSFVKELSEEG